MKTNFKVSVKINSNRKLLRDISKRNIWFARLQFRTAGLSNYGQDSTTTFKVLAPSTFMTYLVTVQ